MEKMLDKKSRDFAKNMRDTMIYDKSKNEVQIGTNLYVDGEITSSVGSGGKVYLHNIYIGTAKNSGYMKLYTTNNEPFTKDTLTRFMQDNRILNRENGFPLCYVSLIENESNVSKVLNFNYAAYTGNGSLKISSEAITFNFADSNVVLSKTVNDNNATSITDIVVEL